MNPKQLAALVGFLFVAAWIGFGFGDAILCLIGAAVFLLIAAFDRSGIGASAAKLSRYLHILAALVLQQINDSRHEHQVCAREQRESECVSILLDDRLDDLFGRLVKSRVDDLKAGVAQGARNDFGAPIMAIETGLRDDDSIRALHQ